MFSISIVSRKGRLLKLAVLAAWFLCPLPNPSAIKTVEVERQGSPSSVVRDERFVCNRTSDQLLLKAFPRLSQGQVEINLLDLDGQLLAGPFLLAGDKNDSWTFVHNSGFPQGQDYRLQCTELGVVGRYQISISQPWTITLWERYLAGLTTLMAGLAITAVLGFFRIGGDSVRRLRQRLGWITFLASIPLMYPVIHEGGHILPLLAFGAWDLSGTSVLGIHGLPHVSGNLSAHLASWQIAVAAIAGPLLPTLLGYAFFAVWVSPFGLKWRARTLRADLGWSALIALLVLPQAVPAPMLFPRLVPDRDYSLIVEHVGHALWVCNLALAIVALVNLAIIIWVVKHIVSRIRAARVAIKSSQQAI